MRMNVRRRYKTTKNFEWIDNLQKTKGSEGSTLFLYSRWKGVLFGRNEWCQEKESVSLSWNEKDKELISFFSLSLSLSCKTKTLTRQSEDNEKKEKKSKSHTSSKEKEQRVVLSLLELFSFLRERLLSSLQWIKLFFVLLHSKLVSEVV